MSGRWIPEAADIIRILPEIVLALAATAFMVLSPLLAAHRKLYGHISIGALALAMLFAANAATFPGPAFSGLLMVDGFAAFFRVLAMAAGILTVLASYRTLAREGAETAEYHALLLFAIAGQSIMAAANDLIVIFIGLEISSLASYVLAGYLRDDKRTSEAALKYFLLGSFATAFFLYGAAIAYGATGTTQLSAIRGLLMGRGGPDPIYAGAAAALLFVGLGFKVASAPFQAWAPDVYQGAPSPVSAFLSTGAKAAAFAIFLRIFMTAFAPIGGAWEPLVWMAALMSMTLGNFAALNQTNVKRMLAYSSIAHAGYVLVALTTRSHAGTAAAMFYLAAYTFMNVGAFAVAAHVAGKGERMQEIDDYAGLGARQPFTAAMLAVFLFSLIGVPLTAGFFGKFAVFKAALDARLVWLAVLGLLNSAVAAYYYLRLLVAMYMREPPEDAPEPEPPGAGITAALSLSAAATVALGIFPTPVMQFASRAAALLK